MAQPFIKWAGGKRQLIQDIMENIPNDLGKGDFRRYAEPFVGGGALMFHLFEKGLIDEAYISDFNPELVLVYRCLKENVDGVIAELEILQDDYNSKNQVQRRDVYFECRQKFNDGRYTIGYDDYSEGWCERAAQFIYLNKTGFNGLFRVNQKGGFNVPPSNMGNKNFVNAENLREVANVLQNVTISCGDFSASKKWIDQDTFVYFDPPYRPLKETSFTTYSSHNWNDDSEQIRLANFAQELNALKINVMLSNSHPKNPEDDFFNKYYPREQGFNIVEVEAIRAINSQGSGRGAISELLIRSY